MKSRIALCTSALAALLVVVMVACQGHPVAPSQVESQEAPLAATNLKADESPDIGGPDNSLWGLEGRIDHAGPGFISAWVRNRRPDGASVDVALAVYKCETGGCSVQTLVDFRTATLAAGFATRLSLTYEGCYQVDLVRGDAAVVRDMSWRQVIDGFVVFGGDCFSQECPREKPYRYPNGACGSSPPPTPPPPQGCPPGQVYDKEGRCYTPPPTCTDGESYNEETHECEPTDDEDDDSDDDGDDNDDSEPPPPPENRACIYSISGSPFTKALRCILRGGTWTPGNANAEHCTIGFPGVNAQGFNLVVGQSAEGCLKHTNNN